MKHQTGLISPRSLPSPHALSPIPSPGDDSSDWGEGVRVRGHSACQICKLGERGGFRGPFNGVARGTSNVRRVCTRRTGERGSAILIVLILLVLMTALVVSNCLALHFLKRELKLVEQKQKQQTSQVVRGPQAPQPNPAPPPKPTP